MHKNKPIIGLTTENRLIATPFSSNKSVTLLGNKYLKLITDAHCIPVLLSTQGEISDAESIIDKLDGLILIGGQDVDASLYTSDVQINYSSSQTGLGEKYLRPLCFKSDIQQDLMEIQLYKMAKQKKIPILGICRGLQLINVAEGGTLHQEIPESSVNHFLDSDNWINYHSINIDKNSFAYHAIGVDSYFTSSLHHQAIDQLGTDLMCAAAAEDNIIELIENTDSGQFIIGVQGHIEQTRTNLYRYENILKSFFRKAGTAKITEIKKELEGV